MTGAWCPVCARPMGAGLRYECGLDEPRRVALCASCWHEEPPLYTRDPVDARDEGWAGTVANDKPCRWCAGPVCNDHVGDVIFCSPECGDEWREDQRQTRVHREREAARQRDILFGRKSA